MLYMDYLRAEHPELFEEWDSDPEFTEYEAVIEGETELLLAPRATWVPYHVGYSYRQRDIGFRETLTPALRPETVFLKRQATQDTYDNVEIYESGVTRMTIDGWHLNFKNIAMEDESIIEGDLYTLGERQYENDVERTVGARLDNLVDAQGNPRPPTDEERMSSITYHVGLGGEITRPNWHSIYSDWWGEVIRAHVQDYACEWFNDTMWKEPAHLLGIGPLHAVVNTIANEDNIHHIERFARPHWWTWLNHYEFLGAYPQDPPPGDDNTPTSRLRGFLIKDEVAGEFVKIWPKATDEVAEGTGPMEFFHYFWDPTRVGTKSQRFPDAPIRDYSYGHHSRPQVFQSAQGRRFDRTKRRKYLDADMTVLWAGRQRTSIDLYWGWSFRRTPVGLAERTDVEPVHYAALRADEFPARNLQEFDLRVYDFTP